MAINPLAAAKRMCERSGYELSNLSLQKILYLAHMYHLGIHGTPIVGGNFQAWDLGPVHPRIYNYVIVFGVTPVGNIFRSIDNADEGTETYIIDQATDQLKGKHPASLVGITHRNDGAWAKNYEPGRNNLIPNNDIKMEYEEMKSLKEKEDD